MVAVSYTHLDVYKRQAQDDAVIVDYVQSQKMHQMLRWLIANYGYMVDSQVIVTWAVDSDTEVKEKAQDNTFSLFRNMKTIETDADALLDVNTTVVYAEYAQKLKKALQGYGKASELKKHARRICIAVFDAATTGRMGLLFYQEMPEHTYLENIVNWHTDTSYFLTAWKKEKGENGKDKSTIIRYIGAVSYTHLDVYKRQAFSGRKDSLWSPDRRPRKEYRIPQM